MIYIYDIYLVMIIFISFLRMIINKLRSSYILNTYLRSQKAMRYNFSNSDG